MIDLNDPRLTAFALGELEGSEREEIASAVETSQDLQREVASIQQSAQVLRSFLADESSPTLTAAQRDAIEAAAESEAVVQPPSFPTTTGWSPRRIIALAVVASLMVIVTGTTAMFVLDWEQFPPAFVAMRANDKSNARGPAEVSSPPNATSLHSHALVDSEGLETMVDESAPAGDVHVGREPNDPPVSFGLDASGRPSADVDVRFGLPSGADAEPFSSGLEQQLEDVEESVESRDATWLDVVESESTRPLLRGAAPTQADGLQSSTLPGLGGLDAPASARDSYQSDDVRLLPGASSEANERFLRSRNLTESAPAGPAIQAPASRPPIVTGRSSTADEATNSPERRKAPIVLSTAPAPTTTRAVVPLKPADENFSEAGDAAAPAVVAELSKQIASSEGVDAAKIEALAEQRVRELAIKEAELDLEGTEDALRSGAKRQLAKRKNEAKKSTWVRSQATPNASQLMIGDHDGLPLEGMQVNVLVDGFRARVLLDLYYFNNRGNRLEGNFKLRLPNEASLYYFAFGQSAYEYRPMVDQLASKGFLSGDLIRAASLNPSGILKSRAGSWTDVKEARVVPREKAAHAYNETVRRRVDPALVEWSGAGVFNARVFPLMPNKLHRVVVGYDVNLQQVGDDLVYALDLPADQGECVVDLNVSALPGVTAEVTPGARPFMSGGRAYYNFKDPANQAINVRFKNAGAMLLTGADEGAGEFFVSRLTPSLPDDETTASSSRAVFLVDTSLSSRPEKFNVWLDMLRAVLTENRDSIEEFAVLFFNIESHWWQDGYRKNDAATVDQLLADCHALSLEGATDVRQALQKAVAPEWAGVSAKDNLPRPDLFLLSDGAVTWGEMNVHRLGQTLREANSGPLFAYQSGMTGTAVGTLEHLARETGGAVFSVIDQSEVQQVARAHRQRPWQLIDVALPGGSDVLVAGRPKFIYPGQSLLVAGRGRPDAEATLRIQRGDQQRVVEVNIDRSLDSALAPRVYGQVSVGQLEDLGSQVEDVAIAYSRHFRVTGQTCSLLMLESEADYQRFNIKPEEDALLVRTTSSSELIAAKLDELTERLGDPKAALTDWLDKLERTPGLHFKTPTALRFAIDRLPAEAFEIDAAPLVGSRAGKADTPSEFAQLLESGKLDYDAVTRRAAARLDQDGAADALRTLSSLIENNPGDPVLTRDVAFSALEWGLGGQAYHLLKRVADLRPFEPQTYQAMSLCLAKTGNADLAMVYYEIALNATWHNRYLDVKKIVGVEYVDLLRRIERDDVPSFAREYAVARLESMRRRASVDKADLVITMMWNTDRTDVDLHVIEPTGEECYYEHPRTKLGGRVTRDVTQGFGPEMYTLPEAKAGEYRVLANYFGSDANRTNVRSKVYVTIYRNYGDPKRQFVEKKTVTLSDQKEKRELATVNIKQ